VAPFVTGQFAHKGAFVLCKTSNNSSNVRTLIVIVFDAVCCVRAVYVLCCVLCLGRSSTRGQLCCARRPTRRLMYVLCWCLFCSMYTLCTVYCVLCTVYCELCNVHCVLCTVYCALCTVYCALCTVHCALCKTSNVLSNVRTVCCVCTLCVLFALSFMLS
jgi:hypothetical protein